MNAERVILAPIDLKISVDKDFIRFIKDRIMGRSLREKDITSVSMLGYSVQFRVVRTYPRKIHVQIVKASIIEILGEPIEQEWVETPSDLNYLLRYEWLEHLVSRIEATNTAFSISGTDISENDESKIIEHAKKLADESYKNIKIVVRFVKNGLELGSLPWLEVNPFGNVNSIRPETKIPPLLSPKSRPIKSPMVMHMKRCFKIGAKECPKEIKFNPKKVVVAIPFSLEHNDLYKYAIRAAIEDAGLEPWKADENINNIDIMCKICHAIQESGCLVAEISSWNVNVVFELGLAYGLGKNAILIKHEKSEVPVDLKGIEYLSYGSIDELKRNLLLFLTQMEIFK